MEKEQLQELVITFENTFNKEIVFAANKEEDGLHIKFLKDLRDYVGYKPFVMKPGNKMTITYEMTREKF